MNGSSLTVIVVGVGRVGRQTAALLDDHGHSVMVIDRDPAACEAISTEYVATVIEGDATRPSVLRQADPEDADVIAALTGDAGVNLGVLSVAEHLADGQTVKTVMRTDEPSNGDYDELVDEIVYPEGLGGRATVNAILGGDVRALEDVTGELEILEVRVAEDAPVAGRTLDAISLPRGSVVVSDAEGDPIASGGMELVAGRRYIVATQPDVATEVTQLFRG